MKWVQLLLAFLPSSDFSTCTLMHTHKHAHTHRKEERMKRWEGEKKVAWSHACCLCLPSPCIPCHWIQLVCWRFQCPLLTAHTSESTAASSPLLPSQTYIGRLPLQDLWNLKQFCMGHPCRWLGEVQPKVQLQLTSLLVWKTLTTQIMTKFRRALTWLRLILCFVQFKST